MSTAGSGPTTPPIARLRRRLERLTAPVWLPRVLGYLHDDTDPPRRVFADRPGTGRAQEWKAVTSWPLRNTGPRIAPDPAAPAWIAAPALVARPGATGDCTLYFDLSPERAARVCPRAVVPMLCLVGSAGGGLAEPLLSDPDRDPRTAGSLPPQIEATTAAPLRPSMELPGGKLWLRGEVPSGELDPHGAVRGASASFGVRLPVTIAEGIALETKPTLTGSASAATHPSVSSLSPGIGFALAQTVSLALPMGLRLATEATLGDRLGIFGASATAPATGEPPLAMRAGATLSTDLDVPFADARLRVGFGVSATGGLALGGAGSNRPYEPSDCRLSLDIGRVGGAPLRVSAPCTQHGLAATPISFGFKTEF